MDTEIERQLTRNFGQAIGYYVGVDLGMARDHSAVVVNEKRVSIWHPSEPFHVIRFAHRFKLHTKYSDVAREVARVMAQLPTLPEKPQLFADSTGVGRPVCDTLRDCGLNPFDVTLSGGSNWTWNGNQISLPKSVLASSMNVSFQNRTIVIAGNLPFRSQLTRELEAFRVTRSDSGNEQFGSRTEADHDDMVVACGLSIWPATLGQMVGRMVII